jgi:O-antigen/teichoic acid export membrane protein
MGLKDKVIRGGAYLAFRQGMGLVLGVGGVILLTRAIGPVNYGLYATALGIVTYVGSFVVMGTDVYLVRRVEEPGGDVYRQAFTMLFLLGLAAILLGVAAIPLLNVWFRGNEFASPFMVMLFTLPILSIIKPAVAKLERQLNYQAVAFLELAGQFIYYLVAIPLAHRGAGVWAPVAGYFAFQMLQGVMACLLARIFLKPFWSPALLQEMIKYGLSYSASTWVWQLRLLVNPLLVGRFAGPSAVGHVALTIRLVEVLSFIKSATWRLSIAALSTIQKDIPRLKQAVEEAMALQVIAVGFFLAFFAVASPFVVPFILGDRWDAVRLLYPFIALSYMMNSIFNMHSSVLYVMKKNWQVTVFHLAHIGLFAGSAFLLLPQVGVSGYGLAEIVAFLGYFCHPWRIAKNI